MRWLTFLILAAVTLTLQSTLGVRLALFGARPDWILVVVVFFALHAPHRDAVLGATLIGFGADLMTLEPLGLLALSYGLVAMLVVSVREYLFRNESVTRFLLTLIVGLLLRLLWTIYHRAFYDPVASVFGELAIDVLVAAIYTAAWAPPAHALLTRMSRTFGLSRPRYSFAGLHRLGDSRV